MDVYTNHAKKFNPYESKCLYACWCPNTFSPGACFTDMV